MRDADPVFVDRTGRRRQLFAAAGIAGGTLLIVATAGLLAGFTGVGTGHLPTLPAVQRTPEVLRQPGPGGQPTGPTRRPSATRTPTSKASTSSGPTASPSPASRRNAPTHTPSHGRKK